MASASGLRSRTRSNSKGAVKYRRHQADEIGAVGNWFRCTYSCSLSQVWSFLVETLKMNEIDKQAGLQGITTISLPGKIPLTMPITRH